MSEPDYTIIYIGVQTFRYSSGGLRLHHIEATRKPEQDERSHCGYLQAQQHSREVSPSSSSVHSRQNSTFTGSRPNESVERLCQTT